MLQKSVAGLKYFPIPYESVDAMTRLNCLRFGGFFASNFCGIFSTYIWRIFLSSFLSHILTFSLILNGFNIGQIFREAIYTQFQKWFLKNKKNDFASSGEFSQIFTINEVRALNGMKGRSCNRVDSALSGDSSCDEKINSNTRVLNCRVQIVM